MGVYSSSGILSHSIFAVSHVFPRFVGGFSDREEAFSRSLFPARGAARGADRSDAELKTIGACPSVLFPAGALDLFIRAFASPFSDGALNLFVRVSASSFTDGALKIFIDAGLPSGFL